MWNSTGSSQECHKLSVLDNASFTKCLLRVMASRNETVAGTHHGTSVVGTAALAIFGLIILIGNGLICIIFAKVRGLRKEPPNILLCNQACADIANGILFIPVRIVDAYVSKLPISPYVLCYCLFVSLFSLCSLAVDRYVAVLQPLRYRHIFNGTVVHWEIVTIWILPLIMTLVPLLYQFKPPEDQYQPRHIFTVILWAFVLVLFLAMVIMYLIVFGNAKMNIGKRRKQLQTSVSEKYRLKAQLKLQKKELHIAALFALFMVFFFITYLPILVINFYLILEKFEALPATFIDASLYSFVCNSVINPLLCILLKKDFKTGLQQLITRKPKGKLAPRKTVSTSSESKTLHSKSISLSTSTGSGLKERLTSLSSNIQET